VVVRLVNAKKAYKESLKASKERGYFTIMPLDVQKGLVRKEGQIVDNSSMKDFMLYTLANQEYVQ
jgi:hypothetical protein